MLAERAVTPTDRDTALSRVPVPALAPLLSAAFAVGQPLLAHLAGITRWADSEAAWGLGLTLIVWYTAVSVPAGVLLARRLVGRPVHARRREYVTAIAPAALGALLATPVVVALARSARVAGLSYPSIEAGLSVPIGAGLGILAAIAALNSPSVMRGLLYSALWVWGAGLLAAVLLVGVERPGTQPLGALSLDFGGHGAAQNLVRDVGAAVAAIGPAAVAAWATVRSLRRGAGGAAAVAGAAAGPLLVLMAYRSRPDVLIGENRAWVTFVLLQFLFATAAAVGALLMVRARVTGDESG